MKVSVFTLAALLSFAGCAKLRPPQHEVTNPFDQPVANKSIVLERAEVEPLIRGGIDAGYVIKVEDSQGQVLPSQVDDLNGDGNWDQLVFQASFAANESLGFRFRAVSPDDLPAFTTSTNINFFYALPPYGNAYGHQRLTTTDSPSATAMFQMEGPGWENDLVGFRNYFDARNGIDIFGKRTTEMVLRNAGIDGQNYHVLDDWGMDILRVGTSLGAGAIAIGIGDSIYRVGPAVEAGFRLLAEGPVRSIFELYFNGVAAGDRSYNVVHRISIYAGDHFYRSKVWVEGLVGDEVLYAGLVNLHSLEPFELSSGGSKIVATFGSQAFDGERLGLGVIVPENQFVHLKSAPQSGTGVTSTFLVGLSLAPNTPAEYAFFSGWELQDAGFREVGYFLDVLSNSALKLDRNEW